MTPDSELLTAFARTHSEAAFAELVRRHVNLVHSAALRQVNGDGHLAQDVAQQVFTDLARKARSLSRRENLTGWLYTSAHFAAAKIVRAETRRRDREEKFMDEPINETSPEANWEEIRPALDAAMHELKEADREAILLRYFENRPFDEVGAKLGLHENAARMRVERALEKLRATLVKRGLTTATALASIISANAVQLAPVGLATTLVAASIATAGTGTFTLLGIMTTTQLKLEEWHTVDTMKYVGLAMRIYSGDHQDVLVTNFDQITATSIYDTNRPGSIALTGLEFMNAGSLSFDQPEMIMFREKNPRQTLDGRWVREYGMVDGSVQTIYSDDGNFNDYERLHSPPNQ